MINISQKNKINLLKALAIMLVVSGHLEFSLIPMFPPYSFQLALFFFISGMVFKSDYGFVEFFKKRFKSLLIPYFLYSFVYLGITVLMAPIMGKFWGMEINLYNEFMVPFLTGHQLDLISPLWFVPQLFMTLIVYHLLNKINTKTIVYVIFALAAIQLGKYRENLYVLFILKTLFSLLFVHLGFLYKTRIEGKLNIFNHKIFFFVIGLEALLWLSNKDYTQQDGIGLSYVLAWGEFDNWIVPILTSITGIWISLFIIEIAFEKIKNIDFLHEIGQNTYHIMANHIFVFNIITYCCLYLRGIPFNIKNNADIYWFYCPLKMTYFYFVLGIFIPILIGEGLKYLKSRLFSK